MAAAPWIVCGDFNTVLHMNESSDFYDGMPLTQSVLDFKQCLDDVGLSDMHCDGLFLTWSNKRSKRFLAKKLDRFLVHDCWLDEFDQFRATFCPPDFSDHCLVSFLI